MPCSHLESELNKGTRSTSVRTTHRGDIDKFVETKFESIMVNEPTVNTLDPFNVILPKHIEERTYEKQLRGRLKRAGLNEIERNVVVFKFVYEMSLKDISEELGIPTLQTAHNILVRSLKQLREKGFGKR